MPDDVERGRDIPKLTTSGFFIHVAAYWVTSLLGVFAFEKSFTTILVILLMHGFFIELVQFFIPYRSFNLLDILANIVGVLAALLLFVFIQLRK